MKEEFDKLRSMLAGLSGDKDKVESSDWGLTLLGLSLLLFTAFRTWDWLTLSLPEEWKVLGIVGLMAFDIGTVVWAHVYLNKAIGDDQRLISKVMFFVCLAGVALTSLGDTSYRSNVAFLPGDLTTLVSWIVPIVVILNLTAYYLYRFADPKVEKQREDRKRLADIEKSKADYETGRKELSLLEQLTNLRLDLEAKTKALGNALGAKHAIDAAADNERARVLGDFSHRFGTAAPAATKELAQDAPQAPFEPAPASAAGGHDELATQLRQLLERLERASQTAVGQGTNGHHPAGDDAKK